MSQLNLTPEEDQLVISALRGKATQYAAMFGSEDPAILELIAKVEDQQRVLAEAAEAARLAEEAAAPKAKKSKVTEA